MEEAKKAHSAKGLLIAILACIPMVACGAFLMIGNKADELPVIELTDQERTALVKRMKQMTIKPKVGVGPIRLGMKPEDVIAVLGQPDHRKTKYQNSLHYRKLGLYLVFGVDDSELGSIVIAYYNDLHGSSLYSGTPVTPNGNPCCQISVVLPGRPAWL